MRIIESSALPPGSRDPRRLFAGIALALLLGVAAKPAAAQVSLFYSPGDNGIDPGIPLTLPDGVGLSIPLYLDGGDASSTAQPCEQGDGEEVCGWLIRLQADGGITIQDFIPDAGAASEWNAEPGVLQATGGNGTTGSLGPTRLGSVVIDIAGTGNLELTSGSVARSNLTLESLPGRLLIVPEPGIFHWPASLAVLASLGRRRARHVLINGIPERHSQVGDVEKRRKKSR
jgi:hypothetical protein